MSLKGLVVPILSTFDPKGLSTAEKQMQRFGRIANGVLIGAAAAAGQAVLAAESLGSAQDGLAQVLKNMGYEKQTQRVTDYADALERTLGVDEKVILATQTKLGTFENLTATVGEAGGAFDRATLAALDLAAAGFGSAEGNAVQLGKALQDPVKGLSALTRSGVTFTKQEQERIKTLVESNKISQAQEVILKAIEKQVGGSAEANADASEKLRLAYGELSEDLGNTLLPYAEEFAAKLEDVLGWVQRNKTAVLIFGGVLVTLAATFKVVQAAMAAYNIVQSLIELNTKRAAAGQWALNAAMFANPVVLVVAGIIALIAVFVLAYKKSETFRNLVNKLWDAIKVGAGKAVKFVTETIPNGFKTMVEGIKNIGKKVFNFITAPYRLAFAAIAKIWNATLGKLEFKVPSWIPGIGGKGFKFPTLPEGIPALAKGGIVTKPTLALIGEAGPEAVVPLGKGKGTGGINITINGAIDPEATARQIKRILKQSDIRAGAYA